MKFSNYLTSLDWDLAQIRQAISTLKPLFEAREEAAVASDREARKAREEFRDVSLAMAILKQRECELIMERLEKIDDDGWLH